MGKFKFSYQTSILKATQGSFRNGIDFKYIKQVIDSLPNETFILSIKEDIVQGLLEVEAENFNIKDGSEIVPKYRSVHKTCVLGASSYVVFDGVDIIDPPTNQPNVVLAGPGGATVQPFTSGNGTYTTPSTTPIKIHISASAGGGGIVPVKVSSYANLAAYKPGDIKMYDSECQCGKDKHGFASHSNWCDKAQKI